MTSAVEPRDRADGLCAVVVTRNRLALLQECVQAIRDQSRSVARILIIDNGSDDGTQAWLETQNDLWVMRQPNLGSAGGFHRGISEAVQAGFEAVWVMDDDVVPSKDSLAKLCEGARRVPEYGFMASRVVGMDGLPLNMPTLDKTPLSNGSPSWPALAKDGLLAVRTATFVSLLIPSRVILEVGLPIAEMFIWGDDTEYTTRISNRSPCYWVLASEVIHKRENQAHLDVITESEPSRIKMFRWNYRNNTYVALHYKNWRQLAYLLVLSFRQAIKALRSQHAAMRVGVIAGGILSGCFFRPVIQKLKTTT